MTKHAKHVLKTMTVSVMSSRMDMFRGRLGIVYYLACFLFFRCLRLHMYLGGDCFCFGYVFSMVLRRFRLVLKRSLDLMLCGYVTYDY